MKPVSVSQLNTYIKRILQTDPILGNITVCGEVSNLTKHSSGHWYFAMKDEKSTIKCFLSRDRVARLRYDISAGMKIIAYGSISVYEPGGYYSLNIRDIDVEGEGELKKAYESLRKKLEDEGLFDEDHKRPIPSNPRRIGVVTSSTGAAVHDIITTVKRRSPLVDVLLYPCLVQGPDAAASIAEAIGEMNRRFPDLDLIICGRGGGSTEDLWPFNEETVVRAVYNSRLPVISAVGHEVDYVLSDFAADLRGATPTAAAELAVPDFAEVRDRLTRMSPRSLYASLAGLAQRAELTVGRTMDSATAAIDSRLADENHHLQMIKLECDLSNPMNLLGSGYAVVKGEDGRWIESIANIKPGDKISVRLKDGQLLCTVDETEASDE
ncbi:MAG: exodeoxyribonuclease VII large subunit [Clostridia bacterium]|nr:exodeoxyribonuclease VII large subunit [Clostridia bacterium]